jgi:hypothetical protein
MTLHKLEENRLTFVEFDRNSNFILVDILPDVVARLQNQ